ncbi:hypothetical protein [Streptomyces sp. NPDC004134]|uniref:hypothetical protein n=1 Tax=Streptomyces sp. NPDC004134 TaxID=3364691 RepID=UPI0036C5DB20
MAKAFRKATCIAPVAAVAALMFPASAAADPPDPRLASPSTFSSATEGRLIAAGTASPTSVTADVPPSWDFMFTTGFTFLGEGVYRANAAALSHGGEFHACISTPFDYDAQYALFEYDEGANADEHVGSTRTQTAGGCETWDVDAYVDGDNNRAELYIVTNDPGAGKTVSYYD